jgi:hypothetical protein
VTKTYMFAAILVAWIPVHATSVTAVVSGEANPLLAGMPAGSICCGDSTPTPPVLVTGLGALAGQTLTFSVAGSVSFVPNTTPTSPPDGDGELIDMPIVNGIAGAKEVPFNALIGVFLNDQEPDLSPAPTPLDFSAAALGTHFSTLSPGLRQVFFIGDGLTGNGSGAVQQFIAPPGATRLFLGAVDLHNWAGNTGSFRIGSTDPGPPADAPEPGSMVLVGVGGMLILLSRAGRLCRPHT